MLNTFFFTNVQIIPYKNRQGLCIDSGTWTISDGGEFGNGTVTLNLRSLYLELPIEMGSFIYGWQDIVFTLMNESLPAPCEKLTSHSD